MKRPAILLGMAAGLVWAVGLLWSGARWIRTDMEPLTLLALAFLPPGLVLGAMIGRLAQRRFLDDSLIDGAAATPRTPAAIDQRVLTNTVEQLVLAICIWPALCIALPSEARGTVLALGGGFAFTRILFWVGYHIAPPLRAFGFAAGHYTTLLAAVVALWHLLA